MNLELHQSITRKDIQEAQEAMKSQPQIELPVQHIFTPGVYARHLSIPKGCVIVGKIHKYENLNYLLKGKMRVSVDGKLEDIEAPFMVVSPAGTQRIAKALEDCIWVTIHGTEEKDLNIIENKFTVATEEEYLEFIRDNQLNLPGLT